MSIKSAPAKLRWNTKGLALVEFALAMPIIMIIGSCGIELANYALVQQKVSSVALQLADNASRIGVAVSGTNIFQLREGDLNDVIQGARLAGKGIDLTTNGRITISSLENIQQSYDSEPVQRIHWQRCVGLHRNYDSSYDKVTHWDDGSDDTAAKAGTKVNSMGVAPGIKAPPNFGVIFIEVNYEYKPVFGTMLKSVFQLDFLQNQKIHYEASFIVRDNREFTRVYNPQAPSGTPQPVPSTCDKYTT